MQRSLAERAFPILLATAVGLSPALAFAQTTGAAPPDTSAPSASTNPQAPPPPAQTRRGQQMQDRVEQRIKELHERLQITPQQESQWKAFAGVMRANAQHMDQLLSDRIKNRQNMNAVENMRSYTAMADAHAQDMQQLQTAFEALYNSFSDSQKKLADEAFRDWQGRHAPAHGAKRGSHG
jgi:CBS-domain-containing membrane protein